MWIVSTHRQRALSPLVPKGEFTESCEELERALLTTRSHGGLRGPTESALIESTTAKRCEEPLGALL